MTLAIDLTAGTVGGASGVFVGQPFDTVKVRLQAAAPGTFTSPLDCLVKTVKNEGVSCGQWHWQWLLPLSTEAATW